MKTPHICAIGNPIVDSLSFVDDTFLADHAMQKGGMQLVDADAIATLRSAAGDARECSGGSAANTVAALAALGVNTSLIGRVADDALGQLFINDIRAAGVAYHGTPASGGKPTATCCVCVTPDGERTMNTFIGASADITPDDVDKQLIKRATHLYIEGYLLASTDDAYAAVKQAIAYAKEAGTTIALTASDAFCIHAQSERFSELVGGVIDILFCNETESLALTGAADASEALEILRQTCPLVVITRSEQPALIADKDTIYTVPAPAVKQVVDATGAGDLFAAGFLYGLVQGKSVEASAQIAHRMAGNIISQLGARAEQDLKSLIAA